MNFPIHFHYFLCGCGILEAGDVFAAAGDAGVAEFGSAEHLSDGGGEFVGAVGIYIKVVGSTRFLQTRAFGSHYGQSALHGFDDGNAETFVARGIDKRFRHLIDGGQGVVAECLWA